MNADPVFVDTNVLLCAFDDSDPVKREAATEWLDFLWRAGAGRISWQVLHEFNANAVRKLGLARPLVRNTVRRFATWQPIDTSLGLMERAWAWMDEARISYWDSLIIAAAERADCSILLSEDFQVGRKFGSLIVQNPFGSGPGVSRPVC